MIVSVFLVSLVLRGSCRDVLSPMPLIFRGVGGEVLLLVLLILRGRGGELLHFVPVSPSMEGRGGLESPVAPLLLRGDGGVTLVGLKNVKEGKEQGVKVTKCFLSRGGGTQV